MKRENDEREPIEVLYDIETNTEEILKNDSDPLSQLEPRLSATNLRIRIIKELIDNEPITSQELQEAFEFDASSNIRKFYDTYLVNRSGSTGGGFTYEVTELGYKFAEQYINNNDSNADVDTEENSLSLNPWDNSDVTRGEYYALKCVSDSSDSPRSKDINEHFVNISNLGEGKTNTKAVTPYLSTLFGKGFVDRTPNQPYRYWLTEEGKQVLDQ